MQRSKIKALLASTSFNRPVEARGWVRTKRGGKKFSFIELNDGSTIHNLQLVVDNTVVAEDILKAISTGASIRAEGTLVQSQGQGQAVELQVSAIELYGTADAEQFPLQKKAHSLEFLRDVAHLRPRTNTFGAVLRIRHSMAYAVHQFFHERGFYYVHTPIITGSDAEGSGEMFTVTTLPLDKMPVKDGAVDFSQDFFGLHTKLTVSGQLEGELTALALGEIYTFGPTFRAENSNTTRHLAEFWMIEPEMAFYDIQDNMDLAEALLQHLVQYALDHNLDDLTFLQNTWNTGLIERLQSVVAEPFIRLDYGEGVRILKESGHPFEFPVDWGTDLQSEHERYLVEQHFKRPVILTNYPKEIKAFYMRQNEDGKTVRAMDVLFPGIGEIIGGSQREERLEVLEARIRELDMDMTHYGWYLDTRRYGSVPHSGFGLGFERLLLFVTGMQNIRDVIPFPRYPGSAAY